MKPDHTETKSPFFSIAIPTYRRPDLLKKCLKVILDQKFEDIEILVGNNDTSTEISQVDLGISDPRVTVINRKTLMSPLENMIDLMGRSRGVYFSWMADDDLYLSLEFFSHIYEVIGTKDSPEVFFTGYQSGQTPDFFNGPIEVSDWQCLKPSEFLHLTFQNKIKFIGNYGVWKLETLRKIGGMKQLGSGFSPYSDTLLGLEAAYCKNVYYLESKLVFFHVHPSSISNNTVELDAYLTAQIDLMRNIHLLLKSISQYETYGPDLYNFLSSICLNQFGGLISRSKNLNLKVWPKYFSWIWSSGKKLPVKYKILFSFKIIYAVLNIILTFIKQNLRENSRIRNAP